MISSVRTGYGTRAPLASGNSAGSRLAPGLLTRLLEDSLVLLEDWEKLPPATRHHLEQLKDSNALLTRLTEEHLLTEYQAARISAGKTYGLVLGNYRVLDRIGAGGMGVVFKGEHVRLRRPVAIKVLPLAANQDPRLLLRFFSEMRIVAQLQHPNIVTATDAGQTSSTDPDEPVLHYMVMEYVPGEDLENYILNNGPLSISRACDVVFQVAAALDEAYEHHLVHRDIKPSNILLTPEGQAKLLDFGLAHDFRNNLTEPGSMLGTFDYMAPEQATDASSVDIRADLYGLGGTFYWCLTGELPFPAEGSLIQELMRRETQPPPGVRKQRPEVPPELEAVVARLMAANPDDRYPTPQAVMRAVTPFLRPSAADGDPQALGPAIHALGMSHQRTKILEAHQETRILIVDDEVSMRTFCRHTLEFDGLHCDEAADGERALEALEAAPYDLVLLDVDMPRMTGLEVLCRLRANPPSRRLRILMLSGRTAPDEMAQMLMAGADDYLSKPFSIVQLRGRVKAALRLKEALGRADLLNNHLLTVNGELERNLVARDSDLIYTRNTLVLALAHLVEQRASETRGHLVRLQRYCRRLAEEASGLPAFAEQVDPNFIQTLDCCAPLHDIGTVALPDHILLKPGKLELDERLVMQSHTTVGAEVLEKVGKRHGSLPAFLQMAVDIARHHHENYDGSGYPDQLSGSAIPLAARLVKIADVYDALRARRPHKPPMSHLASCQVMTELSPGQFDPALLQAMRQCAACFDKIFNETPN